MLERYYLLWCKLIRVHVDQSGYLYKVWRCFLRNERDARSTRRYTRAKSIFTLWPGAHTAGSTGQCGASGWDCGATSKGLEHPTALWDLMIPTLCSVLDKKEKRQFRSNQLLRKHNLWCSSAFVVLTLLVFQSMMKYGIIKKT